MFLLLASPFVGSFLGLLAYRLPRGMPWMGGRSRCPACGTVIAWPHLVPMVGWLLGKGRCASCRSPIDPAYPMIELAAVALAAWSLIAPSGLSACLLAPVGWALLVAAVIDMRHFVLPDVLTLPLLAAGLVTAAVLQPSAFVHHAVGAGGGFAVTYAIATTYRAFRGFDGIGLGDAKLMAAAGAWVGWSGLPSVLLIGSAGGLAFVMVRRLAGDAVAATTAIAFGPFLAVGMWIVLLYGAVVPVS